MLDTFWAHEKSSKQIPWLGSSWAFSDCFVLFVHQEMQEIFRNGWLIKLQYHAVDSCNQTRGNRKDTTSTSSTVPTQTPEDWEARNYASHCYCLLFLEVPPYGGKSCFSKFLHTGDEWRCYYTLLGNGHNVNTSSTCHYKLANFKPKSQRKAKPDTMSRGTFWGAQTWLVEVSMQNPVQTSILVNKIKVVLDHTALRFFHICSKRWLFL